MRDDIKNTKVKLNQRLLHVYRCIPKDVRLADIGSDHGYLPIFALQEEHISYAIASEVAKGPYENILRSMKRYLLSEKRDQMEARFGNGLETLRCEDQINCITIAGMGGGLIQTILEQMKSDIFSNIEYIIVQPNTNTHYIREFFVTHDYQIYSEEIVKENDVIYEVLGARRNTTPRKEQLLHQTQEQYTLERLYTKELLSRGGYDTYEKFITFGSFAIHTPLFQEKWQAVYNHFQDVYAQAKEKTSEEHLIKLKQRCEEIKAVLYHET